MSWKPEVIADSTGKWYDNALRFATKEEAEAQVADLKSRWVMVIDTRVVETDDPVNYRYDDGALLSVDYKDDQEIVFKLGASLAD